MPNGPLAGIRILEFTQIIAGPLGCMLLADLGADVIKVEPTAGEPWRLQQQFLPGESKPYQSLNRGKKSLALDLQHPEAQEIIHRLVADVDVVVSNYRPDVPARLNIDYDTLSALNPQLIYVDSSAFGRRGPWAIKGGYDIVVQGAAGFAASAGRFDAGGNPILGGPTAIADQATGYAIAWAVTTALFHRERTGEGQHVETSLLANALMFQNNTVMSHPLADTSMRTPFLAFLAEAEQTGLSYTEKVAKRESLLERRRVGHIYYRMYLTSDGAITVGCLSPSLRQKLRDALGIEYDPKDHDPNYDITSPESIAFGEELVNRVEAQIRAEPSQHWVRLLEQHGVPVAELLFPEQMAEQEQVLANEYVVDLDHEISGPQTVAAPPLRFSVSPAAPQGPSPVLGKHSKDILAGIGYPRAEIEALIRSGIMKVDG